MSQYLCNGSSSSALNSSTYVFAHKLDSISIYLLPLLSLIGNSLILIVISTNPLFNRSSFSIYVKSMAISDTCVLVIKFFSYLNRKPKFYYPPLCKILFICSDISIIISVWIIVAITIERTLVVLFPLHKKKFVSASRAKFIVLIISLSAVLFSSRTLFITIDHQIRPTLLCRVVGDWSRYRNIGAVILEITYCYIPLTIVIVGNMLTVCTVKRALVRRQDMLRTNTQTQQTSSNENQLMLMLLIVTLMFVIYFVPFTIVKLIPRSLLFFESCFSETGLKIYTIFFFLSTFLKDLNFCTNFFIYSISGRRFRYALKNLFRKIHHHTSQQYELTRIKSDYLLKKSSEPKPVNLSGRNTIEESQY